MTIDIFQNVDDSEFDDGVKPVDELLNIEEVELNIKLKEVVDEGEQNNLDNDYSFVREKLIHSIQKGEKILDNILKMAQMMDTNRDYKIASQVLQMIFEGSKSLMELHKQALSMKKEMDWLPESKLKKIEKNEKTLNELLEEVKKIEKVNN